MWFLTRKKLTSIWAIWIWNILSLPCLLFYFSMAATLCEQNTVSRAIRHPHKSTHYATCDGATPTVQQCPDNTCFDSVFQTCADICLVWWVKPCRHIKLVYRKLTIVLDDSSYNFKMSDSWAFSHLCSLPISSLHTFISIYNHAGIV